MSGPGPRAAAPLGEAGRWRDDVASMGEVMDRLRDVVPGIRWVKPVALGEDQLLVWDGGKHAEKHFGALADWADEKWPT